MMEIELIAAILSAATSTLLLIVVGVIGWYIRKYVIAEIEENSAFRRHMRGEDGYEDSGHIEHIEGRMSEMEQLRREEHAEVREWLAYVTEFLHEIAHAINNSQLDQAVSDPDRDVPGRWRGGNDGGFEDTDD